MGRHEGMFPVLCYLCAHPERATHPRAVGKTTISVCVWCARQWDLKVREVVPKPSKLEPFRYNLDDPANADLRSLRDDLNGRFK